MNHGFRLKLISIDKPRIHHNKTLHKLSSQLKRIAFQLLCFFLGIPRILLFSFVDKQTFLRILFNVIFNFYVISV